MTTDAYIHGTDPVEQRRLTALNRWINARCLAALRPPAGGRILDVGSGLGQFTRDMARAAGPGARVIGVERDPEQLAEAHRQAAAAGELGLAEFRSGDAATPPLSAAERGTFDLAHARFVLEHVRDPAAVVAAMVAAVRPGGRVVLADDDHAVLRLWPDPAGVSAAWEAYCRLYDRQGHDPYVGRRLVSLLHDAGAAPAASDWLFFGACAGQEHFPAAVDNFIGVLSGARDAALVAGLATARSYDTALASLADWKQRPDAALWYAIAWAEGVRR